MKKRKYDAKTGEEHLQHASRYLYETYFSVRGWYWRNDNVRQASQIIADLIKKVTDNV